MLPAARLSDHALRRQMDVIACGGGSLSWLLLLLVEILIHHLDALPLLRTTHLLIFLKFKATRNGNCFLPSFDNSNFN